MFMTAQDRAIRPVLEHGAVVSDDQAEQLMAAEAATDIGAEPGELDAAPALLALLIGPVLIVAIAAAAVLLLAAA